MSAAIEQSDTMNSHTKNVTRRKILFLCTGNSCRSQMAEGFTNALKGDQIKAYSAGIETHGINPYAVEVMAERGIDISQQQSKTLGDLNGLIFDTIITVCSHADTHCPTLPSQTKVIHKGFDDPPKLAAMAQNEKERLDHYRRVRDEIQRYIETL
ncbi:MAG: arsenate reductase ArsC [Candidatus Polarisedimenticolaceae bacterium]|nr:arsenate reductase ArsC [Candidatus Polarisedimenticolaceae bacterium]